MVSGTAMDTQRDKNHLEEMWQSGQGAVEDLGELGGTMTNPIFDFYHGGKRVLVTRGIRALRDPGSARSFCWRGPRLRDTA